MTYSVSQLAKMFGLSRSTLLYYDNLGLLSPKRCAESNYRIYSEQDVERLKQIVVLRRTGISLDEVKRLLDTQSSKTKDILQQRLALINDEINALRQQQQQIVNLLGNRELLQHSRVMSKDHWVSLMRAAGLDDQGMQTWHQEFESSAPQAHQDFLESLGLSDQEIKEIRKRSQGK